MAIIILLAITALYTITGEFAEQSGKITKLGDPEKKKAGKMGKRGEMKT